jgi:peptidylprolyl isomerase
VLFACPAQARAPDARPNAGTAKPMPRATKSNKIAKSENEPVLVSGSGLVNGPPLTNWYPLNPENLVEFETSKGNFLVELRPEIAPLAVDQIKVLIRSKIYDGLLFNRVMGNFIAQSGNPDNKPNGKSQLPNLPAEFTFRIGVDTPHYVAATPQGETTGFVGNTQYQSVDEKRIFQSPDRRVSAWGAFCSGVMAMGHGIDNNGGNSEFFITLNTTRSLDRNFSVVGKVIAGLQTVRSLNVGDPPSNPDKIVRARILSDEPIKSRTQVWGLNTSGPEFHNIVQQIRTLKGADFSVCDVEVPILVKLGDTK